MSTRTCLLSSALVLAAACGESSAPASKPAAPATPAKPAASAPAAPAAKPAEPAAAVTAAVANTVESLKAEAAKADKATVEKVITECKTLVAEKEKVIADLQSQIKEKTASMAQNVLGSQGSSTEALKAEVDKLKGQLDAATKDLSGLNEKLSVYVAELAKRPA